MFLLIGRIGTCDRRFGGSSIPINVLPTPGTAESSSTPQIGLIPQQSIRPPVCARYKTQNALRTLHKLFSLSDYLAFVAVFVAIYTSAERTSTSVPCGAGAAAGVGVEGVPHGEAEEGEAEGARVGRGGVAGVAGEGGEGEGGVKCFAFRGWKKWQREKKTVRVFFFFFAAGRSARGLTRRVRYAKRGCFNVYVCCCLAPS